MQTTVQLFINGQQADFEAFMSVIVEKALAHITSTAASCNFTPEFVLEPKMMYSLKDVRIQRFFGTENLHNPVQPILTRLRSAGISPITSGRAGSKVLGEDILNYLQYLKTNHNSFTKPN